MRRRAQPQGQRGSDGPSPPIPACSIVSPTTGETVRLPLPPAPDAAQDYGEVEPGRTGPRRAPGVDPRRGRCRGPTQDRRDPREDRGSAAGLDRVERPLPAESRLHGPRGDPRAARNRPGLRHARGRRRSPGWGASARPRRPSSMPTATAISTAPSSGSEPTPRPTSPPATVSWPRCWACPRRT